MSNNNSYGQIVKSTALIGGTQVLNILISIVRIKILALFLGPVGIGLAGMYQTATAMVGTLTGLGIGPAGVRQIAEAAASGDELRVARTVALLRRTAWISGLLGMAVVLIFAKPLTIATFGNDHYTGGVALVSLTLLFGGISAGQTALLQGLRKLKELAACNLLGSLFGTVASIGLVYVLRDRGVAPFLVAVAGFSILTSWWYARKVVYPSVHLPWRETFQEARPLLGMGASFLALGLLAAGVAYVIRILIIHELGMHAIGLYTAASNISLLYVGVVINAMGADFYPRLTSVSSNHPAVNRLVNQQAEMGVLMALPGVLVTLLLAPWVMRIFYSGEFVSAASLIRWQILGMGLRVACWPVSYILLAKGMGKPMVILETVSSALEIGIIFFFMRLWGLEGCGIGRLLFMALATVCISLVGNKITGFTWSNDSKNVLSTSIGFAAAILLVIHFAPLKLGLAAGGALTVIASFWCLSRLNRALGTDLLSVLRLRLFSRPKAEAP
ncbi:MAG: O-antigen translocase [Verrucomicrobia bacterium]|nr:O-antigen translocase [Verrucomicrobiota bacterium]